MTVRMNDHFVWMNDHFVWMNDHFVWMNDHFVWIDLWQPRFLGSRRGTISIFLITIVSVSCSTPTHTLTRTPHTSLLEADWRQLETL